MRVINQYGVSWDQEVTEAGVGQPSPSEQVIHYFIITTHILIDREEGC